jgi:opacity protein-like surface antigen
MRTFTGVIIAIASLLWFQTTQAEWESTASLGPQFGMSKSSNEDANWIYGGALRLRLHPALGVEGSINYRQEQFAGDAYTVRSWPVQATGMLYFLPPLVYGAMGAGWYMSTVDAEGSSFFDGDTESKFGWHFGGGLEVPLGGMMLVGDLRYVFLNYDFDVVPGSDEIDSDFYMATAGLLFNL